MSLVSWDQSGTGEAAVGPLSLEAVQQLCCDSGFVKAGAASDKPLAQRADSAAFFKALGVNSLSAFRARFYAQRIAAPRPGDAPPPPAPRKKPAASAAPAVRRRRCTFCAVCARIALRKRMLTPRCAHRRRRRVPRAPRACRCRP
jgi:hypothetical protein